MVIDSHILEDVKFVPHIWPIPEEAVSSSSAAVIKISFSEIK